MPILYGAVAYREDAINGHEAEINSWELSRTYEHPIACPKGAVCDKTYTLISEINASENTVLEQVDMVLNAMEREDCAAHPPRIRINPPVGA